MKRRNPRVVSFTAALAALLTLTACNNFFHELVPSDENRITAFFVPGQLGAAVIGEYDIHLTIGPGADIGRLVPAIRVSNKATLLPVTISYIQKAFPSANVFAEAMGFYTSADRAAYAIDLIKANRDFVEPALDEAIDFSAPVNFLVVSALGNIRQYTVTVDVDTDAGKFRSFAFTKFDNPDLTRGDAAVILDNAAKTITAEVWYPVENIASYKLIPAFETNGAAVTLDGAGITSGVTELVFAKPASAAELPQSQQKTLVVKRPGFDPVSYILTVTFREDPDTIRSITDFRFNKEINYGINYTAMAEIINTGDTGTITVTAYYTGTPPAALTPAFTSPGTVTVGGALQQSGVTAHDVSGPLYYKVVSQNTLYTRLYTVTVNLVNEGDPRPKINSFIFTTAANPALAAGSSAMIDHNAGIILIEAVYTADPPPYDLRAEFTAGGIVSVDGLTQTSGLSVRNFSHKVKYSVKDAGNPNLKRDYWVEVRFVKDSLSLADITDFFFYTADNPGLVANVTAVIDQAAGTIYAVACFDSPAATANGGHRTLVPQWLGHGTVTVGGVPQTSGVSGTVFSPSAVYRVRSADNAMYRDYTVTVVEINTRIYVNKNAAGDNTGVSWANAFRSLNDACAAANRLPAALPREVWIAEGTYRPSETQDQSAYYRISPNTGYIGGFAGTETSKAARTPAAHPVIITGDLGGGVYSQHLFMNADLGGTNAAFEDLTFTKARATAGTGDQQRGPAIDAHNGGALTIMRAAFEDLQSGYFGYGGAVYVTSASGSVIISNSSFEYTQTGNSGGAVYANFTSGSVTIMDSTFKHTQGEGDGGAVYAMSSSVAISGSSFEDTQAHTYGGAVYAYSGSVIISGDFTDTRAVGTNPCGGAVYAFPLSGSVNISGNFTDIYVTGTNSGYGGAVYVSSTSGSVAISGNFTDTSVTGTSYACGGAVYVNSGSGPISISGSSFEDTQMNGTNNGFGGAVYANSSYGSISISDSHFTNTQSAGPGGAVSAFSGYGSISISDSHFTNTQSANHGGAVIASAGSSSISISDSTFGNTHSPYLGGAVCFINGHLTMENCSIEDASAQYGGAVAASSLSASCTLNGVSFKTCVAPLGSILYGENGTPYTIGPGCSVEGTVITSANWMTTLQPSMIYGVTITPPPP
ncbi:MAG: hypothetical protein LBQ55_03685 [Treponema sp.]|jgi:hypothetical protein|nr:hypothetical protein [Treponema sp.]